MSWEEAIDIKERIEYLVTEANISWVKPERIFCYRSSNANTRAYARVWGLSRIWQMTLGEDPAYVVEAISEKFDKLSQKEQDKVLLHEIAHMPKNFSGALVPHTRKRKGSFHDKLSKMIAAYERKKE